MLNNCEIGASLSKLKILMSLAITAFSGGQHEFIQKMEESEEGEKERGRSWRKRREVD